MPRPPMSPSCRIEVVEIMQVVEPEPVRAGIVPARGVGQRPLDIQKPKNALFDKAPFTQRRQGKDRCLYESPAPRRRLIQAAVFPLPPLREGSLVEESVFRFLNVERSLSDAAGWNDPGADRLWLYNLHYFDDLNAAGRGHRRAWHERLVARWITENPPGFGAGWEPYPLSLRIVNWIKWACSGFSLSDAAVHSLAVQTRYLRRRLEYHLLGNHLLANAKALVFAGMFFEGDESEKWLAAGLGILESELTEQILADGGHFERRSEEHTSELQSQSNLVCRLLLE